MITPVCHVTVTAPVSPRGTSVKSSADAVKNVPTGTHCYILLQGDFSEYGPVLIANFELGLCIFTIRI